MDISSVFFGPDGRLRSGFRFLVFLALFIIAIGSLLTITSQVFQTEPGSTKSLLVSDFAILGAALLVGWLCNRFLDKLPLSTLGLSFKLSSISHLSIGLIVGTFTLGLAVLIAFLVGGLSFASDAASWESIMDSLGFSLLVFIIAAAAEEILMRGYAMQTFFHSNLASFGIIFSAFLFASEHLGNPSSSWLAFINTFLGGVWFGVAYWKTRDLWFPFGIHLMWNWMQGAFFGIEVSGITSVTTFPLLKEIDRGPAWLTGEAYGIEAGVACTIALIISTLIIYFFPFKPMTGSESEKA